MSAQPVGHSNSMISIPTFLKSPAAGTVTAVAVGILAGYSASRFGNFGRLSSVVIGGLTCFFTKVIHDMLTKVELGMSRDELKGLLKDKVFSLYAQNGIVGKEAEGANKVSADIFEKLSTTITKFDEGYKNIRSNSPSGLILPSGNWNNLKITLVMNSWSSSIKLGDRDFLNRIEINIPTQKFKLDGAVSGALGITEK
ncbi:MAG: hypothetical protein ABSA17_02140 [Rhabdochlamydiaceae bacterium]|jgi:hypothetical protein